MRIERRPLGHCKWQARGLTWGVMFLWVAGCCGASPLRQDRPMSPLLGPEYGTAHVIGGYVHVTRDRERKGRPLLVMNVYDVDGGDAGLGDIWLRLAGGTLKMEEELRVAGEQLVGQMRWVKVVGWEAVSGMGQPGDPRGLIPEPLSELKSGVPWRIRREILCWRISGLDLGSGSGL